MSTLEGGTGAYLANRQKDFSVGICTTPVSEMRMFFLEKKGIHENATIR
jgi:hypothetical protein